jgi:hypothetical protein
MFRRTKAHPETNTEQLGGEGPRDEVRHLLKQRGIKIENDRPPVAGVTRLPGQGLAGFDGVFDRELTNQLQDRHQQRRRQRGGIGEMEQFLRDGAINRDDN